VCGWFAGLAFLARTQMIGIVIGCFLALVWFALRDRSARKGAIAWSVVALATVTPWFAFTGYVPFLREMPVKRANIPHTIEWTRQSSALDWLRVRVESLGVMFGMSDPYSYVQSFGVVAYLVPLAAIAVIAELVRRRTIRAPQNLFLTAVFIAGAFFFLNLTLYQSSVWMPWLFGWRHGLPFIILIMLAVPWLAARSGRFASALAIVLLISVVSSGSSVLAFVRSPDVTLSRGETQLVAWLNAQPRRVSVITTNAQILGSMSDAHFYWTNCTATGDTIRAMLQQLPIDVIVMYEREARCPFVMQTGPLRLVRAFGDPGQRVFVLQPLRR